ncbi:MAG: hypothetical protein WCC48_18980, partial [Anaeromyxobacteraceae bacterium]
MRAAHDDGDPLADATFQVFSPSDAKRPWATGRTDRVGSLAFLPDVPGVWRVEVVSSAGNGFVTDVSVEPAPAPSVA